jgi:hypothetical protein
MNNIHCKGIKLKSFMGVILCRLAGKMSLDAHYLQAFLNIGRKMLHLCRIQWDLSQNWSRCGQSCVEMFVLFYCKNGKSNMKLKVGEMCRYIPGNSGIRTK